MELDDWKLKNDGSLIWDKNTKGTPIDRIVAEDGSYVRVQLCRICNPTQLKGKRLVS